MDKLRQIAKYPITIGFFVVLFAFSIIDTLKPDKAYSEMENRKLEQQPAFSLQALWENVWTYKYGEYVRDQFLWRDQWVSMYGTSEMIAGKLESNGVWFGTDGYQIAKNDSWSADQERLFPINIDTVSGIKSAYPNAAVRAMIVPSPANMMSFRLRWAPAQIDENAKLLQMYSALEDGGVEIVDLRSALGSAAQMGQEVFYHTDHHWTTDVGAWLAYSQYCEVIGKTAVRPDEALRVDVEGFLGTNYAKTKRPGTVPDTLTYYDLPNPITIYDVQPDSSVVTSQAGLMDKEQLAGYDKYAAFLHGNRGYIEIEGSGTGSILVIKDSYANSFVPYLLANYGKVGVLDPRNWSQGLDSVMAMGGYGEVLVLYSFSAFSEDSYLYRILR